MTPDERERLVRVETLQEQNGETLKHVQETVEKINEKMNTMELWRARAGGVMLALTCTGTALGFSLNRVKNFLFPPS